MSLRKLTDRFFRLGIGVSLTEVGAVSRRAFSLTPYMFATLLTWTTHCIQRERSRGRFYGGHQRKVRNLELGIRRTFETKNFESFMIFLEGAPEKQYIGQLGMPI